MNQTERELFKQAKLTLERWQNCDDWNYPDAELALAKKRTDIVIEQIEIALQGPKPCECLDPQRCNMYDRCCKEEINGL